MTLARGVGTALLPRQVTAADMCGLWDVHLVERRPSLALHHRASYAQSASANVAPRATASVRHRIARATTLRLSQPVATWAEAFPLGAHGYLIFVFAFEAALVAYVSSRRLSHHLGLHRKKKQKYSPIRIPCSRMASVKSPTRSRLDTYSADVCGLVILALLGLRPAGLQKGTRITHRSDIGIEVFGQLNRRRANGSRCAVNQRGRQIIGHDVTGFALSCASAGTASAPSCSGCHDPDVARRVANERYRYIRVNGRGVRGHLVTSVS